jgi:group I intron endonuclease
MNLSYNIDIVQRVAPAMLKHSGAWSNLIRRFDMSILTQRKSGIYRITNTINGKCYIGSTVNFNSRWSHHKANLNKGKHHSRHLQKAWNKYGESVFVFSILETCAIDELSQREQHYIDLHKPEYNMVKKAYSTFGLIHTLAARLKMSIASKGNKNATGFHREKSDEERWKISTALKGRVRTPEHSKKISESKTPEMRARLAQANRDRVWTSEMLKKNSEAQKRNPRKRLPNGQWGKEEE